MAQTHPTLSIIIPCYNHAHWLPIAIESALAQKEVAVEVIVVNDGSTDNTIEVASKYANVILITQVNKGLAAARNAGLKRATGTYASFLDADDALTPYFGVKLIQATTNQNTNFAFCAHMLTNANNDKLESIVHNFPTKLNLTSKLFNGGFFPPVCVLGKTTKWPEFPLNMDGHADYAVWMFLALSQESFAYTQEPLALYRILVNSMSKNQEHMERSLESAMQWCAAQQPQLFFQSIRELQIEHCQCLHLIENLSKHRPTLIRKAIRKLKKLF